MQKVDDQKMKDILRNVFHQYKEMDAKKLVEVERLQEIFFAELGVHLNIYHEIKNEKYHEFIFQIGEKGRFGGLRIFVSGFSLSPNFDKIDLEEKDLYEYT